MIFIGYSRCSTSQKARKWMDEHGFEYTYRDIREQNPTADELRSWHKKSGLPLRKFFNTSGNLYKEMKLKDRLAEMSEDEQYELLATDGMLVKRPLVILDDYTVVGFNEDEWEKFAKIAAHRAAAGAQTPGETKPAPCRIHESVYLAEGSIVFGDVVIGEDCGIWYHAVVRGDETSIRIGKGSNVQDNAVIHGDTGHPVSIGEGVTIGHGAIVHGCTVGNHVLIGMGAIILNDAVIEDNCVIGAGALVTQGTHIPAGSIAFGNPAKVVKTVSEEAKAGIRQNAAVYVYLAREARDRK